MRCKAIAVSALALTAGTAAHAQSSVTLYGVADAGLQYISNTHDGRKVGLSSGNNAGSRWGMRGVENLGNGLKAIFKLENGYDIANGKMGHDMLFGRQAFVGLQSDSFGTLTFGRQYPSLYDALGTEIADGGPWASPGARYRAHPADIDDLDGSVRINNAVKYTSPRFAGYQVSALYSFGGVPGSDHSHNEIYDISANFTSGPFLLAAGYLYAKRPNYSFWGDKADDNLIDNHMTSPVMGGYASAGSQQIIAIGAAYAAGPLTVGASYSNVLFRNLGTVEVEGLSPTESAYRGRVSFDVGELNARYQMTPAMFLAATYSFTRNRGADGMGSAHYHQLDLGTLYALSKRTSLYVMGAYQRAKGTDSTGAQAVAAISSVSASSSNRQFVASAGIIHKF